MPNLMYILGILYIYKYKNKKRNCNYASSYYIQATLDYVLIASTQEPFLRGAPCDGCGALPCQTSAALSAMDRLGFRV